MIEYTIITDSSCDISPALLKKWGVEYINLTYRFDGEDIDAVFAPHAEFLNRFAYPAGRRRNFVYGVLVGEFDIVKYVGGACARSDALCAVALGVDDLVRAVF